VVLPPPARVVPAPLPPPLPTVEPALQPTIEPAVEPTVQMPLVVRTDLEPTAAQVVVPAIALADDEEFDPADEFPDRPPSVPGGRRWFLALLVLLAIGGGVLAWYNTRPETSPVPALAGMRQGEALNQLGPFKGAIGEEASETVEAGVVVRTEPVEGTVLEHGKTVTIFVSTGPAPRVLPELAGLTIDAAKATLIDMGLVPIEADAVFSEEVPPGVVVSWSVPAAPTLVAGATVTKGTTVQIVASSGPAPRVVPDLTNMPAADATAAVTGLQLLYAQAPDEFSNTVPAGAVIRQDLPPGSEAAKGATVTVVLSKGPDLVAMPPLAGLDYNAIRAAIEAAGLTVGSVTGDTAQPFQSASVSGSAVADGQQFLRGTAVDLTFAPTPVVTTVP
jgi:serine/threonine-protein kinase